MEHVHLNGTSYEVGLQHGRALAHLIPRVIATSERNQTKRKDALWASAVAIEATLQSHWPELLEEMRGIAEGVGLDYREVLLLNVGYDARYALDPPWCCTAIGLPGTGQGPLVGKTDDVAIEEREFEVFFRVEPASGHSYVHYAFAGTVWDQGGINDAGLALAMTGLGPAGAPNLQGLPSLLFLRQVLQYCGSVEQALVFARAHPLRTYGCTMTMADTSCGDITVVENYPERQTARRSRREATIHTNHPQFPESLALPQNRDWAERYGFPGLPANSRARAENASRLVNEIPWTAEGLQQLLGNHAPSGAICQHGQAGLHTSFAIVLIPRERTMLGAEGYGCEPYVTYTF